MELMSFEQSANEFITQLTAERVENSTLEQVDTGLTSHPLQYMV